MVLKKCIYLFALITITALDLTYAASTAFTDDDEAYFYDDDAKESIENIQDEDLLLLLIGWLNSSINPKALQDLNFEQLAKKVIERKEQLSKVFASVHQLVKSRKTTDLFEYFSQKLNEIRTSADRKKVNFLAYVLQLYTKKEQTEAKNTVRVVLHVVIAE